MPKEPRLTLGTHGRLNRPYVLGAHDVNFHRHVIGKSGQGKSKFIESQIDQLWDQRIPFALIDPHTDLADAVLGRLADKGVFANDDFVERIWYIDFSRSDRYLPFNILNQRYLPYKVAEQLLEVCRRVWPSLAEGAAPSFENILFDSASILIHNKLPVTELPRVITNKAYRDKLLENVPDVRIVENFHNNFDRLVAKEQQEQMQSTLRRINILTRFPVLKYSMGQLDNTLDFRGIMDYGVSVIFNLGGEDITKDARNFLGAFLTLGFEEAAQSRAQPGSPRNAYHIIIDEFENFASHSGSSMNDMLSQTRKYGGFLTMSHQSFGQISLRLTSALQNCVRIAFQLGRMDAEVMAKEFAHFEPEETKAGTIETPEHERIIGGFTSVQETFEKLTTELMHLPKRHLIVKAHQRKGIWPFRHEQEGVSTVKALNVPLTRTSKEELARIKDRFARMLMVSVDEIKKRVDAPMVVDEALPPKRKVKVSS